MQGQRIYPNTEGALIFSAPGQYGQQNGIWYAATPLAPDKYGFLTIGNLSQHEVTEHEDGSITVSPSILVGDPGLNPGYKTWHGWLERGVWREA